MINLILKKANSVLARFGFQIQLVKKRQFWNATKNVKVPVGKFLLEMPSENTLVANYTENKNYSALIGRLAGIVHRKYTNLCVVDIGANVGDTAGIIQSVVEVPIICIEGDEKSFFYLERNILLMRDVEAHQNFLGEKTETISAKIEKSGWNLTIRPEAKESSVLIKLTCFDEFIKKHPNYNLIKLIKIDTEGFDCAILRGSKDFISYKKPIITFEYNRDNMDSIFENGLDALRLLELNGYSTIVYHDCFGRFICSTSLDQRVLLEDFHNYADGHLSPVIYFDLTVFHIEDHDIAEEFIRGERFNNIRK